MFNFNEINFKKEIYLEAFSHTSYANENNCSSYERLEFLGDAILEFVMSNYLYNRSNDSEGNMTKNRAHFVCEEALAIYTVELGLDKYILLGSGEEDSGGRKKNAILADVFESFLGALYKDKGIEKIFDFFNEYVVPIVESNKLDFLNDYKTMLQEYVQTAKKSLEYNVINESGPSHEKEFVVEVKIDGIVYGKGIGSSKKGAEQLAAYEAIKKSAKEVK